MTEPIDLTGLTEEDVAHLRQLSNTMRASLPERTHACATCARTVVLTFDGVKPPFIALGSRTFRIYCGNCTAKALDSYETTR